MPELKKKIKSKTLSSIPTPDPWPVPSIRALNLSCWLSWSSPDTSATLLSSPKDTSSCHTAQDICYYTPQIRKKNPKHQHQKLVKSSLSNTYGKEEQFSINSVNCCQYLRIRFVSLLLTVFVILLISLIWSHHILNETHLICVYYLHQQWSSSLAHLLERILKSLLINGVGTQRHKA